ncbi:MAG: zeta toxin family protein [Aquabacterium sp.]|uniref:zeta toxin family protein n=1 Tax=Aquabacterium sp. TaxID=1872578 RepID=UPI002727D4A1|nr:zeta toxin family protein [Aquabacterium sp.]MDO9005832.1 zeta toxin family protein [Aquabacterium sp.]
MASTAHVPRIFVLAGTNGAGKSSIGGANIRRRGGHYFNPDEAAAAIRRAQPHLSATQANSAAWHEGKRLLQQAVAQKLDYNFETTLGGRSFTRLLEEAALQGFEVRLWYVGLLSADHHIARVKARVAKGGHDIPEVDIRRRFDQSRLQLIQLLPHLTELRVYDNTVEADPQAGLAPQPRLVLHWQGAQRGLGEPGRVAVPLQAAALANTPDWAKPIVAAAFKEAANPSISVPAVSPKGVRPARNRPAK